MTPIGFALHVTDDDGSFQKWGVDEPRRARLLSQHLADDVGLLLLGRIHYREEWLRRLTSEMIPHEMTEAELALRLYRQLGPSVLAELEGDFALVCWDRPQKRAFARRDVLGGYSLFWRLSDRLCSISTSLEPIVATMSSKQLSQEYMADFLMLPAAAMDEVVSTNCVWEGVQRLLPGALLSVDWRQRRATVERANLAPFCNRSEQHRRMTFDEATDRFRETLTAAVRTRVSGKMAAHVSGGFDSTSVAILAAEQQPHSPLEGLSLVFNRLHGMSIERPYVDAAYAGLSRLRFPRDQAGSDSERVAMESQPTGCNRHDIEADDLLDFDAFIRASQFDEPCPYLSRLNMESPMLQVAAAAGANTLLTGSGGDATASLPKTLVIAERLRQGTLRNAWQQATRFSRASSRSVVNLMTEAVHELLPFSWRGDWSRFARGGFSSWEHLHESSIPPWIRPEFARRLHLADRARDIHSELNGLKCADLRRDSPLSRFRYQLLRSGHGNFSRWYEAAELGMSVSHPFFDPRLVKLSAELDDRHVAIPGQQKPLLTSAMGSRLPLAITQRSGKGHFGEVYFRGLAKHRAHLTELVQRVGPKLDDVINTDVLLQCLHAASLGFARDAIVTDRLNVTLALIHWLNR